MGELLQHPWIVNKGQKPPAQMAVALATAAIPPVGPPAAAQPVTANAAPAAAAAAVVADQQAATPAGGPQKLPVSMASAAEEASEARASTSAAAKPSAAAPHTPRHTVATVPAAAPPPPRENPELTGHNPLVSPVSPSLGSQHSLGQRGSSLYFSAASMPSRRQLMEADATACGASTRLLLACCARGCCGPVLPACLSCLSA